MFVPAFERVKERYLLPISRLGDLPGGWSRHTRKAGHFLEIAHETLDNDWGTIMPRKNGNPDFQIEAWVNVSLSDLDKEHIIQVGPNWDDLFGWIGRRIYEGYRLGLAWDDYSQAVQVSIICRNPDLPDYGLAMSARHPDVDRALQSLWYKDNVIGQEGWRPLLQEKPLARSWD